jgi:hypothetical protein
MALLVIATVTGSQQHVIGYDTLWRERGGRVVLLPKYDTTLLMESIDKKTDTIMNDLKLIKQQLGIVDTTKTKKGKR